MRLLYFDCFSGASGDMILGALIDAGVPLGELRRALGTLAVSPDSIWTERVTRAGITATKFHVAGEQLPRDHAHDHGHDHDHHHDHDHDHDHHDHGHGHGHGRPHGHSHAHGRNPARGGAGGVHPNPGEDPRAHVHVHRSLEEIYRLIDGAALSAAARSRARELFERLGEAEAAIHGVPLEQVHLHEVGALDSIVDIVGTVYAMEALGVERVVSSPLNVGGGTVRSAHGLYPVPAPATIRLLQGVPVYSGGQQAELVTPSGALLVTSYASQYGPIPPMRVERIGYGAGSRDFVDTPNVLRVLVGEAEDGASRHGVVVLEAEIDDMNPQIFGALMDLLLAQGALDVFYTPIQMKKNRPGTLLTVVAPPELRERLIATVFRETTTIGVRYRDMLRECLDRDVLTVATAYGAVRIKVARRNGKVVNAAPEFDDCVRLAAEHQVPLKDVQAAATKAYLDGLPAA